MIKTLLSKMALLSDGFLSRSVYFFRRTVPQLVTKGGAIHIVTTTDRNMAAVRSAIKYEIKSSRSGILGILQHLRLIRLRADAAYKPNSMIAGDVTINIRLEPLYWPGSLILKVFQHRATLYLHRLKARIYETSYSRPRPFAKGPLQRIIRFLCKYPMLVERLRLSPIILLKIPADHQDMLHLPPFQPSQKQWLIFGDLYAMTGKHQSVRLPRLAARTLRKVHRLNSPVWLLTKTKLILKWPLQHQQLLHGYLIKELPARKCVRQHSNFKVIFENSRFDFQPGKYGGFDLDFPFQSTEHPTFLFFESDDGSIECFQISADYFANHVQRFYGSYRKRQINNQRRFFEKQESITGHRRLQNSNDLASELPDKVHPSVYISQIDLHVVNRFQVQRSQCLWQQPLDAVPAFENDCPHTLTSMTEL